MIGEVIAGAIIGAGASISTQFVAAWSQSRSDRYIKKIEYLQKAQEELLEYIKDFFVFIPSLDEQQIIEKSDKYIKNINIEKFMINDFSKKYHDLMKTFMRYRHLLDKEIRVKCDNYFCALQKAVSTYGVQKNDITPEQTIEIVKNIHVLFQLVFLGLLKSLESISDKVTK